MDKALKFEIMEVYEALIENGVIFYYGSECIPTGEITGFDIFKNEIIEIQLDEFNTYEISLDDFIEYHSKEGANYHTWSDIRKFDRKLFEVKSEK